MLRLKIGVRERRQKIQKIIAHVCDFEYKFRGRSGGKHLLESYTNTRFFIFGKQVSILRYHLICIFYIMYCIKYIIKRTFQILLLDG
jgi:hypothetical protein